MKNGRNGAVLQAAAICVLFCEAKAVVAAIECFRMPVVQSPVRKI